MCLPSVLTLHFLGTRIFYNCGVQEFKYGICATCHTLGREDHYRTEEVTRSDNKATSMAHYRGGHIVEKELRGGG